MSPAGRLTLDSGIINTELLTRDYGEEVAEVWAENAIEAAYGAHNTHQLAESEAGSHAEALRDAADTRLPVSQEARELFAGDGEGV